MQVQYVTNEKGKKTAVQIPLKKWDEIQEGLKKLVFLDELKQAFKEMELHKEGKLNTLTTKQLLSQL
jgi:hypothetical protein